MSLTDRISADIATAMKEKDAARLDALRAAKTALTLREVEAGKPLGDAEAAKVLETLIKQRREAVEMFQKGGRQDLAAKDEAQIAALEAYLPKALSLGEIEAFVEEAVAETGAKDPKQQGVVMKAVMAKLAGRRADGKEVARVVGERLRRGAAVLLCALLASCCGAGARDAREHVREHVRAHIRPNVPTDFTPEPHAPVVAKTAYVFDTAIVIGDVEIGERVFVGPHSFLRADEGHHIHIGADANVQDGAGVHALETIERDANGRWHEVPNRAYRSNGAVAREGDPREDEYAVWIGDRVSIAHQALVHGPAWIGEDTFIGMQAQVFQAKVGKGCVVAPRALVMGVTVADGRLVPAGAVITTQAEADALPPVKGSQFETLNRAVVHVNTELAESYRRADEDGTAE